MALSRKTVVFAALSAAVALLFAAALFVASIWKRGQPYQEPFRSPNGQYYVQKFVTAMPRSGAGPGQGSDSAGGYIRLFTREGKLLQERRQPFFRDVRPVWAKEKVYLLGVAEMDNDPWILPTSSE